jgi:transmembrane sensor
VDDRARVRSLFDRYLAGRLTDDERVELEQMLLAAPNGPALRAELEAARSEIAEGLARVDLPAAIATLHQRIGVPPEFRVRAPAVIRVASGGRGRRRGAPWPRPAGLPAPALAAAVLLFGVAVAQVLRSDWARRLGASTREFTTGAGRRLTVTLVDGTQLTLAPASHVRLASDYGAQRRDVYLDGEALFAVSHDAARPFAVHARNAVAEDVGTRFTVRSYLGEPAVRVVVADGAVSLGDTLKRFRPGHVLPSGTLGEVDKSGVTHVTAGVNVDDYIGWTAGRLVFHDALLSVVVSDLERTYNLEIRLADPSLATQRVTAVFGPEAVGQLARELSGILGRRVERHDRQLIVLAERLVAAS